jgi:hypothetical protein
VTVQNGFAIRAFRRNPLHHHEAYLTRYLELHWRRHITIDICRCGATRRAGARQWQAGE